MKRELEKLEFVNGERGREEDSRREEEEREREMEERWRMATSEIESWKREFVEERDAVVQELDVESRVGSRVGSRVASREDGVGVGVGARSEESRSEKSRSEELAEELAKSEEDRGRLHMELLEEKERVRSLQSQLAAISASSIEGDDPVAALRQLMTKEMEKLEGKKIFLAYFERYYFLILIDL